MKIHFRPGLAAFPISLVGVLISGMTAYSQNSNQPSLTITPQREPRISIHGSSGARYQLQFTPNLSLTNWQVLTNFILQASPYTVVDSNAPLAGIRMYRALLLETNASVNYAPTTLNPAEVFRFTSQGSPTTINDTLVLNSPTTGLLQQNSSPNSGLAPVTVMYSRSGPFLAQMTVIRPPTSGFPTSQTNYYTLVFTGPATGFFQVTDGVTTGTVGEFSRDQSLVGQQIAPVELAGGEIYTLLSTNAGISNLTTLVINSTTSGMLISPGNPPPGSITPVSIEYQLLGPLSCQLQVVIPASSGFPSPQTNLYYLVYTSANSGSYQSISGPAIYTLGQFVRDPILVGQQLAPAQLLAGEIYSLLSTNFSSSNLTTLVINSATSGVLISPGNPPPTGASVTMVGIDYLRLGPLSSQLQVVIPGSGGFPTPQTNWYYFVHASTNSGAYQSISGPAMVNLGPFTRDTSLVGQQIAPAQLVAGEIYSLLSVNAGISNLTTLVINSATSGMLISPGNPPPAGASITPVSIEYQRLGSLSCQLQVIIPASGAFPTPQTNLYHFVFASANSGSYQSISGPAMVNTGPFTRDLSLVGQQIAPVQLAGGEIYSLLATNAGISNLTTLVISSATSGMLISSGNPPSASITSVSIEYQLLGSLSGQLQVVIPASSGFPTPQTNFYFLVYSSATSGSFQSITGPAMANLGAFTRDLSLVGQQIAPAQLAAGETYSLLSVDAGISNLTTLVINSATNGMLISAGNPPPASITPVNIEYQRLGSLSCQLQVVVPASGGFPTPRTNLYHLVYLSADSGSYQSITEPVIVNVGAFRRDPSLIGQQIAPTQLAGGESYGLLSTNAGISNLTTLVINSATSGMLISAGNPPPAGAGITTVSLDYLRLGPLSSQLQVVIPGSIGFPTPQTNFYFLVYSSANSGTFQSISGPAMVNLGPFTRDQSLVGQQIAPTQLTAGESYRMTSTSGPSAAVEALLVNAATNGILIIQGSSPEAGIYSNVALEYLTLAALSGQIQAVIPPNPPMILTSRTNTYLLVYTSSNSGQFQRSVDPGMVLLGQFQRISNP